MPPSPCPAAGGLPHLWRCLFLLYLAGVVPLWLDSLTDLRLRLALGEAVRPEPGWRRSRRVAARLRSDPPAGGGEPRRPTAFVWGWSVRCWSCRVGPEVDHKVILHELMHFKHRDAAGWLPPASSGASTGATPCCGTALTGRQPAEARCDQRVLERLEGEDRRDYGRILLSMADERYARAPGTTSLANGGRNIKARIQAIARFKGYPAGMGLVSVCIAVVTGLPLSLGRAQTLAPAAGLDHDDQAGFCLAMASARLTLCTTPAGALDAYGKAVLEGNGIYRALCAPLADHPALAAEMEAAASGPDPWVHEHWESGLPGYPDAAAGYFLYNLEETEEGWDALVVWPLQWAYLSGPEAPPAMRRRTAASTPPARLSGRSGREGAGWSSLRGTSGWRPPRPPPAAPLA